MPILTRLVFLLLLAVPLHAQDFCSTVTDGAFMARFDALVAAHGDAHRFAADTGIIHIPVTFHVELQGGSPVVSDARLARAVDATNLWFAEARVQFVKCGETLLYASGTSSPSNRRTVNVSLYRGPDGCGAATGSFVSINVACNRTLENILSHELGHVMGLPHTHGYTNSGTTNELADGSNCATAGDRFCDTPADPNLLGKVNGSCVYTGTARDANGMAYDPLTDNIMSYTNSACADSLTPMQLGRVREVALASSYTCCAIYEPIVSDTSVCVGASAVLRAWTPIGELSWYETPEGGTPVGSGDVFVTPPLTSSKAWYVEAADSCVSPRARVLVQVLPATGVLTADGARLIRDLDTAASSAPSAFMVIDSLLAFRARQSVWVSDGTAAGTRKLADVPGEGEQSVTSIIPFAGVLLYGVNNRDVAPSLWRADPSTGDVARVVEFPQRAGFSNFWLTDLGEWVLFMLNDGNDRMELWRTDGSTAGTSLIAAFPETNAFKGFDFTPFRDGALFQALDSLHGTELWFTDGTGAGTRRVADLWEGPGSSDPGSFTLADGLVYFSAADSLHGRELWVTDGTAEGTRRITDINPGPASSQIGAITPLYGSLYFYAANTGTNYEPFVSDGTPEGTRQLADIRPDNGSFPSMFTAYQGEVYCAANDGSGTELWALHPKGLLPARLVRDINPLSAGSIAAVTVWNDRLYFAANDGKHGSELWSSDGTEAGTYMVADIDTLTNQGGAPAELTPFRSGLYFSAFQKDIGRELFAFTPRDFATCSGEATVLSASNGEGTVRWFDAGDAVAPLATGPHFQTPPLPRSRSYWADVTVGGCTSLRTEIPVTVRAPEPSVRDTSVAPGSDVTLHADAESGTIEWYAESAGGSPISKGSDLQLRDLRRDTTLFVATREEDCVSRRVPLRVTVGTNAIGGMPLPDGAELYPQPAGAVLHLRLPDGQRMREVLLLDLLGRELRRLTAQSGSVVLDVPLAGLPDGQYFLLLRGDGSQRVQRFLKRE